jgi:hypothetical protein
MVQCVHCCNVSRGLLKVAAHSHIGQSLCIRLLQRVKEGQEGLSLGFIGHMFLCGGTNGLAEGD